MSTNPAAEAGFRVLAVDDSSTVRAILAKTLRVAGIPVSRFAEASSGRQALDLFREHGFDLVFCDLNMPGMTGFELVRSLREKGFLVSAAVVIVSSLGYSSVLEHLRGTGIRGYLRKPLRPEDVREVVNRVMGAAYGPAV